MRRESWTGRVPWFACLVIESGWIFYCNALWEGPKRYPSFYGIWRFINIFTTSHHRPSPQLDQFSPYPRSISWRSMLILSSHIRLCLPSGQVSPSKPCMHLFYPHKCSMPHQSHSCWVDHPSNIYLGVKIMKLLFMQSSPVHCYLVRLSPNILITPSEAEKHKHWYIKKMNIRACDNTEKTLQLMYNIVQLTSALHDANACGSLTVLKCINSRHQCGCKSSSFFELGDVFESW